MNGNQIQSQHLLAVGDRLARRLEQKHQEVSAQLEVPKSIFGIDPLVQEILLRLRSRHEEEDIETIVIFHNSPQGQSSYQPVLRRLLPLDLDRLEAIWQKEWPNAVQPGYQMEIEDLFSAYIREHLFVLIFRAAAEFLASENGSRLASMQAAEKNIEEYLADLEVKYRHLRQSSITAELRDMIVSYQAQNKD